MIPVISIVGRSDCGKTTYLEKLIREIKQRGYRVATIKHDVHGFDIDKPGKDTWRHAQAGADIVCISSPEKMAMIKKVDKELLLEEVAAHISGVDIIFTEGYKRESTCRIEVFRKEACESPLCLKDELFALASDTMLYDDVPHFSVNDPAPMADFLETTFLQKTIRKP
ncbi:MULTISPECIES: molybdopterin-guanine dinucleotide biosynthesis protein B [Sporomusa]|uniref:molybdopterin-guanine dinucleotide biosynthesis protein B n=1 Tax=Sporomusa TaxID=2375 RepID=UPI0016695F9E|nr:MULTISPECIES: molybdopterin-guanine dinucleotide biosynthesis protein B [Sporomusa]MCM0758218.1 molybdopterin-guanine dinucleotide biosynthesis protein B [Sporomusa sphaeroides DSM 2875]HML31181.1 molybdopterin-guanine dinucleotide biosynthesis protein B [Sporomusa sphaeroides]